MKNKISDEEILEIFLKNNNNYRKTQEEIGVSYPKMKRILVDKGLFTQRFTDTGRPRENNLKDDFFEIIDTKEKAYWLGFLWGDGFISNNGRIVGVSLSIMDYEHLDKLKTAIGYEGEISVYNILSGYKTHHEDGTPNQYCRLLMSSKKMVEDLKSHGFKENKSLIMTPPIDGSVPINLMSHFIRGLFDANGSICVSTNKSNGRESLYFSFLGTMSMLQMFLENSKYKTTQTPHQRKKDCPIYSIRLTVSKSNIYVLDYVYLDSECSTRLNRKYDKYMEFCEKIYNK